MVKNRKRGMAAKAGLTLLAMMLFFTFFSGTISSFLTPKVTITMTRQGLLNRELDFYDPVLLIDGGTPAVLVSQLVTAEEAVLIAAGDSMTLVYAESDGFVSHTRNAAALVESVAASDDLLRPYVFTAAVQIDASRDISPLRLNYRLPAMQGIVIPLSSVAGGGVWVVRRHDTFLGSELRIERRYVTVAEQTAGQALISEGLESGEYIVTSWDRPLSNGSRVMLPTE